MQQIQHSIEALRHDMSVVLSTTIVRLVVAAMLGGAIGLERELRHKPAGLRTTMFICFGSAMFTVLSSLLAGTPAESARIASTIVTGIGFIGAGAILHSRGSVTGLTTAATIFVTAAVGMAAGGGLYVTAVFATAVILIALKLLGWMEAYFEGQGQACTFEVVGSNTDAVLSELGRILSEENLSFQNVSSASVDNHARVTFTTDCSRPAHQSLNVRLHQSTVFASVQFLGSTHPE